VDFLRTDAFRLFLLHIRNWQTTAGTKGYLYKRRNCYSLTPWLWQGCPIAAIGWENYGTTMPEPPFAKVCVVLKKALEYLKTVNVFAKKEGLNNANNC